MKPDQHLRRNLVEAVVLATTITCGLAATAVVVGQPVAWLEAAAVWASFGSTWLCTRQSRFNYVFAVVATALLVVVFLQARLYGSAALNLYLVPTVVYGFFVWGRDRSTRPVEHVSPRTAPVYLAATAVTWAGAYWVITTLGGAMTVLDGWLLVGSVLAQYLMDRKKIECWFVWVAVNVASVYVYAASGLYLLATQYVFFLANACYAWFAWRRTMVVPAPRRELLQVGS